MTNQYPIYPYRQNNSLIKAFFAKPLTLFIAIGYALLALLKSISVLHSLNGSVSIKINFDAISIIICAAFFILYFGSKNRNPNASYKTPYTMLFVAAIINIIVAGLSILMFALLFAAALIFGADIITPSYSSILLLIVTIIPTALLELICAIALLLFAKSINKSISTVFLSNKGATALGISSILLAVTSIASSAIIYLHFPTIIHDLALVFKDLAAQFGGTSNYEQILNSLNYTTITPGIKSIIETSIGIILNILVGIFALSYRNYINRYIKFIDDGNVPQQPQAEYSAPIAEAQPVSDYSLNQSDNPYVQNVQNTQNVNTPNSAEVICGNCGTHCNPKAVFCPGCGEKLK